MMRSVRISKNSYITGTLGVFFLVLTILYLRYPQKEPAPVELNRGDTSKFGRVFNRDSEERHEILPPVQVDPEVGLASPPKGGHVKLIIVGMMRGGTSFVNMLIHSHPKTYMVYEPIWYMKDPTFETKVSDQTRSIRERTKKEWLKYEHIPEPFDFMESMLNCEINRTQLAFIRWTAGSRDMSSAMRCKSSDKAREDACMKSASQSCQQKPVRLAKVVRLSMSEAGEMMDTDPNLRILYLARDPRGSRNSNEQTQKKLGHPIAPFNNDSLAHIEKLCKMKIRDAKDAAQLRNKFGDRVLVMRYEDIADDPMDKAKKILNYLGLDMTKETTDHVMKMTSNKALKGDALFSTSRKDSGETAHRWRDQLGFKTAAAFQTACSDYFSILKYNTFDTEESMRNHDLPDREQLDTSQVFTLI